MSQKKVFDWKVVSTSTCELGEGPLWDAQEQVIYWVDIAQGRIYKHTLPTASTEMMQLDQKIGCLALQASGLLIAGMKNGFHQINFREKTSRPLIDPEKDLPDNRFNDGKCDPFGNFWAGTMDEVNNRKGAAALYMLNPRFKVSKKIDQLSCSNGLAWSADHKKFYLIDTGVRQLFSYTFDPDTLELTNKKLVRQFRDEEGIPDGMCIDSEGMLWIAHWGGWKIARYHPVTGARLDEIKLPVARVTSCCFGGRDMDELYITTARIGLTDLEFAKQPLAGALFVVNNTGYKGGAQWKFG